jgi:OOP family OmpA-OmpF porin
MRPSILAPSLLLAAAVVSSPALAQTLPSIDTHTFRPPTDPNAGLVLEPAATPGPGLLNLGAWMHYSADPVTLRDTGTSNVALRPVTSVLGADLTAGYGIGDRGFVGVDVPLVLYQNGDGPLPSTVVSNGHVPTTAIGDLGLFGKATIISNSKNGLVAGFGLAALGTVTLPTGDRSSFYGDGSLTAGARLLAEYSLLVASVQASLGYTLHTDHHTWPDASVGGVEFGDTIPWTFGFSLKPGFIGNGAVDGGNRQLWEVALRGWLPAGPVAPFGTGGSSLSPVLVSAADKILLGHYKDGYVIVGVDIGLNDAVGVPLLRGIVGVGWAPHAHDRDHDFVLDDADQCPEDAEDLDGVMDFDGCPEDDADDDGITDPEDACPTVKGVPWNDPRKNGCPAPDADGDGIADPTDACPTIKGVASDDPKKNGCPATSGDRDNDGIPNDLDKCPDDPEDKDGFEDGDGCPDTDNDADGVPDAEDACPSVKGEKSDDPKRNGCPSADRDGDTFPNETDQCPDQAEVFNGVKDDDGCPDEGGTLIATVDEKDAKLPLRLTKFVTFSGKPEDVAAGSLVALRAIVLELNKHPGWSVLVGVRPGAGKREDAEHAALERAALIEKKIDALAFRSRASEAAAWDAVKQQPTAASGVGFLIVTASTPTAAKALTPGTPPDIGTKP